METILAYINFLVDNEYLIVDIAQWKAIFIEIGEGSKKFWDDVWKIGDFHRKEYSDKGIHEPEHILKYMEKTNWYTLKQDSKINFTLVLVVSESTRFIKIFFEGFFSNYPQKVAVQEEFMKIRINFL